MAELPPCGLYRTNRELAGIPAGRLVYFHNHGEPGPGLYLPQSWKLNRAQFSERGQTLPSPSDASGLEPLPGEGLYRVREAFFCCAKQCRRFEPELLVQLGYNAAADAIVFVPEWTASGLAIPESGTGVDRARLSMLQPLRVAQSAGTPSNAH
ncbi:MAG: hypothetical protein JST54_34195 [Deltaproteobacteria bacterium]|nr:hypothetical protein [Deltaproteobacteria bacterium]